MALEPVEQIEEVISCQYKNHKKEQCKQSALFRIHYNPLYSDRESIFDEPAIVCLDHYNIEDENGIKYLQVDVKQVDKWVDNKWEVWCVI